MKRILFFIILTITAATLNKSVAQYTVTHDPTSNQFSTTSMIGGVAIPFKGEDKTPRLITWTEFGDGKFSLVPNPTHNYIAVGATTMVVSKGTGIYVPPPPPNTHMYSHTTLATSTTSSEDFQPFTNGNASNSVELVSNVPDIAGGDEMYFAINYKIPQPTYDGWKIVVGYNNLGAGGGAEVFKPINDDVDLAHYLTLDGTLGYHTSVPLGTLLPDPTITRQHRGETSSFPTRSSILGQGLPTSITDHEHFIIWDIKDAQPDSAGTVFFTLLPNEDIDISNIDMTSINVTLVAYDKTGFISGTLDGMEDEHKFNILAKGKPHDPNYETVKPLCNLMPEKPGKTFPYHVHFQNTGVGAADDVEVTTYLPHGVDIRSTADFINSLKWTIAGESPNASTTTTPIYSSGTSTYYSHSPSYNFTVTLVTSAIPARLVFHFAKGSIRDVLSGYNPQKGLGDITTMGDIWFNLKSNTLSPDQLSSHSAIVFGSYPVTGPRVLELQPAILTEPAVTHFKKCCDCNEGCKTSLCNGPKKRSRFWKWLFCKECK